MRFHLRLAKYIKNGLPTNGIQNRKKIDFLKICQNRGLGKLFHKIYLSDRLEVYLFFDDFFLVLPMEASKIYPKIGTFVEARVYVLKANLEKINPGYKTLLFHNGVKSN